MPDFWRDVHCIFGLPFDAISEAAAVERVRTAARDGRRLFLSTPNLNFAVGCSDDADFRDSVVRSDLSTPDGAPVVWLARLMGIPLIERVTGSDLFDRVADGSGHRVAIYFFGGADGVAARAAQRLNDARKPGAVAVGHRSPGFVAVEAASGPAFIDPINASGAEFVVVALGAKKGQRWIEHNRAALNAPVVSHLGAVVNFVAGTVRRAPLWLQRSGMEWLWRIVQEPGLWRRYWHDGWAFVRYALTCAVPWAVRNRQSPQAAGGTGLRVERAPVDCRGGVTCLVLAGAADNGAALEPLRIALTEETRRGALVTLDLQGVRRIDSGFIALVQMLEAWQRPRATSQLLLRVPPDIARAFRWAGAAYVLETRPASVPGLDPSHGADTAAPTPAAERPKSRSDSQTRRSLA